MAATPPLPHWLQVLQVVAHSFRVRPATRADADLMMTPEVDTGLDQVRDVALRIFHGKEEVVWFYFNGVPGCGEGVACLFGKSETVNEFTRMASEAGACLSPEAYPGLRSEWFSTAWVDFVFRQLRPIPGYLVLARDLSDKRDFEQLMVNPFRASAIAIELASQSQNAPSQSSRGRSGPRSKNDRLLAFDAAQRKKNPDLTDKEVLERFKQENPKHPVFDAEDPEGALRAARSRQKKKPKRGT